MSPAEFSEWIKVQRVGRTVISIQQHHTYSPDYSGFNGSNHFDLQRSMKNYHVNHNGWSDLGQHFTSFPDGSILTGRSMELSPAGIYGANANSICFEHLGNFDAGRDNMTDLHSRTIVEMTASVCAKFSINADENGVLYHHWFNLVTGERNNGSGSNKSCPGTFFFGGNKVENCRENFLPLVETSIRRMQPVAGSPNILKYAVVTASNLIIRIGPGYTFAKDSSRAPVSLGAILRVFREQNGWLKISGSQDHWVSARYTKPVKKAEVKASLLNARSGPGLSFSIIGSYIMGQEIFIESETDNWCKINMEEKWVSKAYLEFS